jgi:hypothetical protein
MRFDEERGLCNTSTQRIQRRVCESSCLSKFLLQSLRSSSAYACSGDISETSLLLLRYKLAAKEDDYAYDQPSI